MTRDGMRAEPGGGGRGFTLIELMVVIGVIGVLVSLLLPSLATARERARATKCAAQLHVIGAGLQMYANDNGGWLPTWSGWQVPGGNGTGDDDPGLAWTEQIQPYVGPATGPLYNCPSFPEQYRINYFLTARYSYMAGRHSIRFSEVQLSTQYVLSGDCTSPSLYPATFGNRTDKTSDDGDKDDATQEAVLFGDEPGGVNMHRGGNNVLFFDQHVVLEPGFNLRDMTYHPRKIQAWADVTAD